MTIEKSMFENIHVFFICEIPRVIAMPRTTLCSQIQAQCEEAYGYCHAEGKYTYKVRSYFPLALNCWDWREQFTCENRMPLKM